MGYVGIPAAALFVDASKYDAVGIQRRSQRSGWKIEKTHLHPRLVSLRMARAGRAPVSTLAEGAAECTLWGLRNEMGIALGYDTIRRNSICKVGGTPAGLLAEGTGVSVNTPEHSERRPVGSVRPLQFPESFQRFDELLTTIAHPH